MTTRILSATPCRAPENILELAGVNAADGCSSPEEVSEAARANGEARSNRPDKHKH